eukprot:CAMPEP_0168179394 /NCGR_PEP_ID=MMETSP0139_2-20121125/9821_1 /TAXON_ID=44445 /ORGANISM="Pseudo-nitzschia australis, Strain 10249 10 AB" /LENGTH=432 /DNA_ID=CAMNT_0008099223 /DNA_START=118 /DNA_END=1416 /DNA_ORIENTATION=-
MDHNRYPSNHGVFALVVAIVVDDPVEIEASKLALSLIQSAYHQDYYNSSISHHYFVRMAPSDVQEQLSVFVWSDSVLKQIRTEFRGIDGDGNPIHSKHRDRGFRVIPDVFDQVYFMRPEPDLLDEKKIHYDGNLKLSGICTIRALTYLSGKDATLFALTSGQNYTTHNHTSIVLDFDRELHYVTLNPHTSKASLNHHQSLERTDTQPKPRVMIKSALHVIPPGNHPLLTHFHIGLHRIMVFGARSFRRAFESQSDPNLPSKFNFFMVALDNTMRSLNKIHIILPLLVIGLPLGVICVSPIVSYPLQFFPYVFHIVIRCLYHTNQMVQNGVCWILTAIAVVGIFAYRSRLFGTSKCKKMNNTRHGTTSTTAGTNKNKWHSFLALALVRVDGLRFLLLHVAWLGVCFYFEANAEMVNIILLAPWEQSIYLDDIL